jgi:hypothetical protein
MPDFMAFFAPDFVKRAVCSKGGAVGPDDREVVPLQDDAVGDDVQDFAQPHNKALVAAWIGDEFKGFSRKWAIRSRSV